MSVKIYPSFSLENFTAFSKKFGHVSDLSVSSQVIYVGNGHIGADYNTDKNAFILDEARVVSLINILEPRLGISSDKLLELFGTKLFYATQEISCHLIQHFTG